MADGQARLDWLHWWSEVEEGEPSSTQPFPVAVLQSNKAISNNAYIFKVKSHDWQISKDETLEISQDGILQDVLHICCCSGFMCFTAVLTSFRII